jgi:hypothetical protein
MRKLHEKFIIKDSKIDILFLLNIHEQFSK